MGGMTTAEHRRNLKKNPIKMLKKTLSMFRKKTRHLKRAAEGPEQIISYFIKS